MTRRHLRQRLARLAAANFGAPIEPVITRARGGFGEWSSNAPLEIARIIGSDRAPDAASIGETLRAELAGDFAGRIELLAGRLNFFMSDEFLRSTLETAAREGAHFGAGDALSGQRVLVEFVSADPTGPLPFVAGRHAALGESICRLLEVQGARVTREFYLNDATSSSKIRALGEQVSRWYLHAFGRGAGRGAGGESSAADEGFARGVAAELARSEGAKWLDAEPQERAARCAEAALQSAINAQKATLERFGVRFDDWVSERALRREGRVDSALEALQNGGFTAEREGALWLLTSKFGDETDRVLRRQNGEITYFGGDIAYQIGKAERGFERILTIWSAEHEPYVARTRAALEAAGVDTARFEFIVCGGATLQRDGATLRLGSGGGPLILDEELGEIDGDALKFHFLSVPRAKNAAIDLEIARRDAESNPAYAAQLLPARLARLERETQGRIGQERAGNDATTTAGSGADAGEIEVAEWSAGERELARLVALWSDEASEAALSREPARVARFVLELSDATRALLLHTAPDAAPGAALPQRLQLLRAARGAATVALRVLGIEARERF